MRFREWVCLFALVVVIGSTALAQVNTVDLDVRVLDPSEATIKGAKVTVKNLATSATRAGESDESGRALFVQLPPGRYQVTVEATGFAKLVNPELVLTIGRAAEFHAHMKIQTGTETVTVTETTEMIETRRTAVSETVDSRQITNLPINGRNYINFTLTNSQAARDSAPSIGAAPTSGINFGGARARSNQVSVDGADATDNSVNGVRATVSQEAVQEFQVIMSNYMPEFGRATGGVINIVTKGGSNEVHGNVFGFLRHKSIQARNPFSVQVDPTTGAATPVKQGYTRFQGGATLGGPIKKDKTFYFLSYETTRRQESGFTNIGSNNFGLSSFTLPCIPVPLLLTPGTAGQGAFYTTNLNALTGNGAACTNPNPVINATIQGLIKAAVVSGAASAVALNGNLGAVGPLLGLPAGAAFFPLPIDCNISVPGSCTAVNLVPLPASYVGLRSLMGNYPVKEGTSLWSARLDHQWNDKNSSFMRVNVTPSKVTGIQVNAQNQNFGQNAGSRTSLQQTRDFAVVGQHVTAFTQTFFNEFRFQFARRGLHYGFADLPGGSGAGINITGFAFFGREPFATVDRIERRWQWTDNMTWTKGRHSFKFGGDVNLIQLRSKKEQIFELNFGAVINFGGLTSSDTGLPTSLTAAQAYGLGAPQVFIQGIGSSRLPFSNKTFAGFIQDSWKVHPRLTLNYGVRYDLELTPIFPSSTAMNRAAENALGIVLGIPQDKNNWSPRFALAWDPQGNGNTLVRAGYGVFFDHPLLAVAFNSATADGARSTQLLSGGGSATRTSVLVNPTGALNAGSIFQGVLNAPASFGYLPAQQRFDPKLASSIFINQNYITAGIPMTLLPFTLHVAKNFRYGYAQQGNLTVERKLWTDYKISASYTYTHAVKLNRPRNITPPNAGRLIRNYRNAFAAGLTPSRPTSVAVPTASIAPTAATCGLTVIAPSVLGVLNGCPASPAPNAGLNGQYIGTAAIFNFFRPTGPNPSFGGPGAVGYPSLVGLATLAGFPTGFAGVPVPFSDVMQQESSGGSVYHGLTINFSKRFSKNFEILSSWTWSHSIDDSTDLQTLLAPQNNSRPDLERGNSTFDQRHRWITSAVITSPWKRTDPGAWHKLFADFTVAPILEWGTGRPYTVLTGSDFNIDFGSNTDRPSVAQTGGVTSPFVQGQSFLPPTVCPADPASPNGATTDTIFQGLPASIPRFFGCTGTLGRNVFFRPRYFTADLRISRKIHFNEKWNMEIISDMFNLTNKFNVGDVSPLCNPLDPSTCRAGEPTASLDPRQFQFAIKINW